MPDRLFSAAELEIAETLGGLIYANPFKSERLELNRRFFELIRDQGFGYEPMAVADGKPRNLNIESYIAVSRHLLTKAVARHRKEVGKPVDARHLRVYENLVYVYLFHWILEEMDHYIRRCLDHPLDNRRWEAYASLEREFREWFGPFEGVLNPDYEVEVFAGFCFQIRRAYYHAFHTLKGNSVCLNRMRARVWDSVFTHDMRRYIRSLYNRMSDIYTLICGPSGSGKEVVARCIGLSRYIPFDREQMRFERNFTESFHAINLSALSPTLIESELFGHKKGAFTGALSDKVGYFESSGTYGTVFLDEIGDTDPLVQVKLLRVLQTRQFQRLGDTRTLGFQGKVMAATNVDLVEAMKKGTFREDLYYRLCADQIRTPSLKEILQDEADEINILLKYVCGKFAGQEEGERLESECREWIHRHMPASYEWPGNFRELEQCVRNIMIHGEYNPHRKDEGTGDEWDRIRGGGLTLDELIGFYVRQEYSRTPSLVEVGLRLKVDPRTVKKYLR